MREEIYSVETNVSMKKGTQKSLQILNNFDRIIAAVSTVSGVSINQILNDSRQAHIVRARRVTAFLAIRLLEVSKSKISRLLDLDRTSVIHMEKKVEQDIANCDIVTTDLLMDSVNKLKNNYRGDLRMSRNKYEKSIVSFGMYDDGMLITVDGESIFHEMNSRQMVGLAIELLERSQLSANLQAQEQYN